MDEEAHKDGQSVMVKNKLYDEEVHKDEEIVKKKLGIFDEMLI